LKSSFQTFKHFGEFLGPVLCSAEQRYEIKLGSNVFFLIFSLNELSDQRFFDEQDVLRFQTDALKRHKQIELDVLALLKQFAHIGPKEGSLGFEPFEGHKLEQRDQIEARIQIVELSPGESRYIFRYISKCIGNFRRLVPENLLNNRVFQV
jgi:hypothetical protein